MTNSTLSWNRAHPVDRLFIKFRDGLILLILFGYLLLNYGFMQLRIGFVPVGELLLFFFILTTRWVGLFDKMYFTINVLPVFIIFWGYITFSVAFSLIGYGVWALRDASHMLETTFLLVGFSAFGSVYFRKVFLKSISTFFFLSCLYSLTYPIGDVLKKFSPQLMAGSGQIVSLFFNYTNSALILLLIASYLLLFDLNNGYFSNIK